MTVPGENPPIRAAGLIRDSGPKSVAIPFPRVAPGLAPLSGRR